MEITLEDGKKKYDLVALTQTRTLITIGRDDEGVKNTICLSNVPGKTSFDISKISRRHALLIYVPQDENYQLRDHSHNGTEIEREGEGVGKRRFKISHETIDLQNGDKLYFAGYGPVRYKKEESPQNTRGKTKRFGF